jgi:hypothetical protein
VSTEVTTAVVCALAMGALAAGFAKEREPGSADPARAAASAEGAVFAGAAGPAGRVPRVAPRTVMSSRVHAGGGAVMAVRRGASVSLSRRPGGAPVAVLGDRTAFGSPTVLAVVRRKPGWMGVLTSLFPNGALAWVSDQSPGLEPRRNRIRILVDRSDQRLDLLRGGTRVMSVEVGVGRPGSETPAGHFAVTDKLSGRRFSGSYGCCILALSGRQSRLPRGWAGGDRLAIHGTDGRSAPSVGSVGCVALDRAPLERLMRSVPIGTVVTIQP